MKIAKITLKVLTPMFSFGDDSAAEFRLTELKSLMRSTFRELYCFENLEDMKEKEGTLFGNTGKKSPINFKLKSPEKNQTDSYDMLPHKAEKGKRANISALDISSEINLYIIVNNTSNLDFYINLLIQASIVGSLGKRSRKGFGSFKVIDVKDDKDNRYDKYINLLSENPISIFKNKESSNNTIKIKEIEEEKSAELESSIKFYNHSCELDYPYIKKITLLKLKNDQKYLTLIKKISQLTHDRLNNKLGEDFTDGINNKSEINRNILGNCKDKRKNTNRFASPIYISFSEHGDSRYLIIKELNYRYVLKTENLDIKSEEAKANNAYIEKYIKELIKIGKGII